MLNSTDNHYVLLAGMGHQPVNVILSSDFLMSGFEPG